MKRLFILLAACLFPLAGNAQDTGQDNNLFNHLALGLSAGTEGISAEAAMPVTDYFIIRAGYGTLSFIKAAKFTHAFDVDSNDPWEIHQPISATFRPTFDNIHALLDIFPGTDGAFRFTVGGYYMLNRNGIVHGATDEPLPIDRSEYCTTGVKFTGNGKVEYATTDENGYMNADLRFGWGQFVPYAGIGFSRAIARQRVRLLFDMGAMFTGGYEAYGYDYGINGSVEKPQPVRVSTGMVDGNDGGLVDKIAGFPVYPVLKFSLFYNLF